jgi:hypothetical protein
MAVISGGEVAISYVKETTFGVTPAGAKAFWRLINREINANRDVLESAEISGTGMRSAGAHGRQQQVGRFSSEYGLVYQDHGLEWSTGKDWIADGATGTEITDVVNVRKGISILKQYGPTANSYKLFKGCMPNSLTLRLNQGAIPTLEYDIRGASGGDLITPDTNTPTAAPTNDTFSPFTGTIAIGTLTGLLIVTAIELTLTKNISSPNVLFQRDPVDNLLGSQSLAGRVTVLADTTNLATIFGYGFTEQLQPIKFRLNAQPAGTQYHEWELPACKLWPPTDAPTQEGEFPMEITFRASPGNVNNSPSGTTNTLMRIRRKNT